MRSQVIGWFAGEAAAFTILCAIPGRQGFAACVALGASFALLGLLAGGARL